MRNVILMMIVLMPVLAVNAADTWWVDNGLSDYEGHTGKSETLAFRTIQEAVDVARDDDTILVKPGDYNEGLSPAMANLR